MTLQLAVLNRTRTALQAVVPGLAVDAVQVTTDDSHGAAVAVNRGAVEYGFGSNVQERAATLVITVAAADMATFESMLDAAYEAWENFAGDLSEGGSTYDVRMIRLTSESKIGGVAAGQLYQGTQSYSIAYV